MLTLLIFIGEAVRDAFDPRKIFAPPPAPGRGAAASRRTAAAAVAPADARAATRSAARRATCASASARRRRPSTRCAASRSPSQRGETLALVGESGSGKSVTALSILQLLPYPQRQPSRAAASASQDTRAARRRAETLRAHPRRPHRDDLPGADDLAQPAAHDRAADRARRCSCTSGLDARRGARARRSSCCAWSASAIRSGGSAPIRTSSRAASASG